MIKYTTNKICLKSNSLDIALIQYYFCLKKSPSPNYPKINPISVIHLDFNCNSSVFKKNGITNSEFNLLL